MEDAAAHDPEAANELRDFLAASGTDRRPVFGVTIHHGSGHINQAGRDIHVHAPTEQDRPTVERLAAMHPERAAQQLGALSAEDATWLLASMRSSAAAQVLPHLALPRVAAIVAKMNPHRCADMLRATNSAFAGKVLAEVGASAAIGILGAGRGAWPAETIVALGEGRAVAYAHALGDDAAFMLEPLATAAIAVVVEGMDVPTGVATLERLSPTKCALVLPAINRWQRATLARKMRPELLDTALSHMSDIDAQLLLRDLGRTADRSESPS